MSEILSIEEMKKLASPVVEIPGFDNQSTIKVRMKKPSLMSLVAEGKVPNHLLGIATEMVGGSKSKPKKNDDTDKTKEILDMLELYCEICLVEPTYSEFKEIATDEQKQFIFDWGMGDVAKASTFRNEKEVQSNNNDGKTLPEETK